MRATNSGDDTLTFRYLTVAMAKNINFQCINNQFYTGNIQTSKTVDNKKTLILNIIQLQCIVYRIASNLGRMNVS